MFLVILIILDMFTQDKLAILAVHMLEKGPDLIINLGLNSGKAECQVNVFN